MYRCYKSSFDMLHKFEFELQHSVTPIVVACTTKPVFIIKFNSAFLSMSRKQIRACYIKVTASNIFNRTYSARFNFAHLVEQMVSNFTWSVVSYLMGFSTYLTLSSTYLLYSFGRNSWITALSISVNLHFL